jgi:hypothetical protein
MYLLRVAEEEESIFLLIFPPTHLSRLLRTPVHATATHTSLHHMSKLVCVFVLCGVQRINHFAGMQQICRKGDLAKTLSRMARLFPHDYSFHPKTWVRHIILLFHRMSRLGMRRIDGYSRLCKDAHI